MAAISERMGRVRLPARFLHSNPKNRGLAVGIVKVR